MSARHEIEIGGGKIYDSRRVRRQLGSLFWAQTLPVSRILPSANDIVV